MSDPISSGLKLERRGGIAEIVIDRPEKRNALSFEMWASLPNLVAEVEADDSVGLLIVRGRGGTFSAGADISEFERRRSNPDSARTYAERVEAAQLALITIAKPSIAMIDGYCLGGGCELALACDLRFAARTAIFGITPANLGLVYSFTSTRQLVGAVGAGYAKYLLFSAVHIDGVEASRARLVDHLVEDEELEEHTFRFAERVVSRSQVSVHGAKVMIGKVAAGLAEPDSAAREIPIKAILGADYREGVRAFLEKRSPQFGVNGRPSSEAESRRRP